MLLKLYSLNCYLFVNMYRCWHLKLGENMESKGLAHRNTATDDIQVRSKQHLLFRVRNDVWYGLLNIYFRTVEDLFSNF
ncbi:hypothetical protein HanIR_Chr03g0101831 [Helianthus annuus]|nr:hypothetical protein HanIR_Chr03g0101831 [Helianthus annuus]